jgi:hypothetical protein
VTKQGVPARIIVDGCFSSARAAPARQLTGARLEIPCVWENRSRGGNVCFTRTGHRCPAGGDLDDGVLRGLALAPPIPARTAQQPVSRLVELHGRETTRIWECAGPSGAQTLVLIHGVALASARVGNQITNRDVYRTWTWRFPATTCSGRLSALAACLAALTVADAPR